jgi:hypothetical protein
MHYMHMNSKKARVTDRMGVVSLGEKYGKFLTGSLSNDDNYAIITDAFWWMNTVEEITNWLEETQIATRYKHEGMVLTFECKEDLAMFLLRWG